MSCLRLLIFHDSTILVPLAGFGYSDVENLVPCQPDTVMRIASISKSITMAIAARLMDQGKLDIDLPIENYLGSFPQKVVDGEKVSSMILLYSHTRI